ncbi:MAG: hypothetical protein WCL50_14325 [Spirochaetota bacterium]
MFRVLRSFALVLMSLSSLVAQLRADESSWLSGLATSADRERLSASALDSSRLEPVSTLPVWSGALSAPWSVDGGAGSLSADPVATLQLSSPATSISNFSWKLGAGAVASVSRDSEASALLLRLGPLLTVETVFRLSALAGSSGSPGERLRAIELGGRLRGNERTALNKVLAAATLAAGSAATRADAEYALAKAAYFEKNARRIEIDLGDGRRSRAEFAEARDAMERARLEADNYTMVAESLGREARALSLSPATEGSASFSAKDLYPLALALASLCSGSDPSVSAAAEAAAPWDLRLAELDVQALNEAPRLSATFTLEALSKAAGSPLLPSANGTLSFALPLSSTAPDYERKGAMIGSLRREATGSAASAAALRFAEAERALALGRERIATLEALAAEREARAAAWGRLAADGTATALDALAATASLAEARASLDREKAGLFISAVTALTVSGLPFSAILQSAPTAAIPGEKAPSGGSGVDP